MPGGVAISSAGCAAVVAMGASCAVAVAFRVGMVKLGGSPERRFRRLRLSANEAGARGGSQLSRSIVAARSTVLLASE